VTRGRRDLAAIVGPVLLKPHASGRYLIAEGRFNTGALLGSTHLLREKNVTRAGPNRPLVTGYWLPKSG
jgi:hypothetical protein